MTPEVLQRFVHSTCQLIWRKYHLVDPEIYNVEPHEPPSNTPIGKNDPTTHLCNRLSFPDSEMVLLYSMAHYVMRLIFHNVMYLCRDHLVWLIGSLQTTLAVSLIFGNVTSPDLAPYQPKIHFRNHWSYDKDHSEYVQQEIWRYVHKYEDDFNERFRDHRQSSA